MNSTAMQIMQALAAFLFAGMVVGIIRGSRR